MSDHPINAKPSSERSDSPLTVITEIDPGQLTPELSDVLDTVTKTLDQGKAEDIATITLEGKSTLADYMVVASGNSSRHINALTDQLLKALNILGIKGIRPEGSGTCDWVLVDSGSIIVHIFKPEVRAYYDLERLWSEDRPEDGAPR